MAGSAHKERDDLIEWPIFSQVYRDPRTFQCQHSFHLSSSEDIFRDKLLADNDVECPLCRGKFNIISDGDKNLGLKSTLNSSTYAKLPSTRFEHERKGWRESCGKPATKKSLDVYCVECEDMRSHFYSADDRCNSFRKIEADDADEVVDEGRIVLSDGFLTKLERSYKECEVTLEEIENEERQFLKHTQTIVSEIADYVKCLKLAIKRNEAELLAYISAEKSKRLNDLEKIKRNVCQQMESVKSLLKYAKELTRNGSGIGVSKEANGLVEQASKLVTGDNENSADNKVNSLRLSYTSCRERYDEIGNLVGSVSLIKVQFARSLPEDKTIGGMTTLDKELFVKYSGEDIVVYDTDTYNVKRRLKVPGLGLVNDMTSCLRHRCLYIGDWKNNVIHRVDVIASDPPDDKHAAWTVGDQPAGLSVNNDCDLIVSCLKANKIKVFTTDGRLVRELDIGKPGIVQPWHTIQLTADRYLVSHGDLVDGVTDRPHGICIVDGTGDLLRSFDGRGVPGVDRLNVPARLAAVDGFVFVVDVNNHRVLMLSSTLSYIRTVSVVSVGGLPTRIWFDEPNGRLYIDENRYDFASGLWTHGHVDVYEVRTEICSTSQKIPSADVSSRRVKVK